MIRCGCSRLAPARRCARSLAACSTNPVTGKKDLMLVGEGTELSIGQQQYAPMRQAEGGDYCDGSGAHRATCSASAIGWPR